MGRFGDPSESDMVAVKMCVVTKMEREGTQGSKEGEEGMGVPFTGREFGGASECLSEK